MFFLFSESRYKTSENPLSFALCIAFKTYATQSKCESERKQQEGKQKTEHFWLEEMHRKINWLTSSKFLGNIINLRVYSTNSSFMISKVNKKI